MLRVTLAALLAAGAVAARGPGGPRSNAATSSSWQTLVNMVTGTSSTKQVNARTKAAATALEALVSQGSKREHPGRKH
jgi:hypothetical protein